MPSSMSDSRHVELWVVKKRIWRWLWNVSLLMMMTISAKTKTMIPLSPLLVCEIFSQSKLKPFFPSQESEPRNSIKIIFWRINVDWSNNTYGGMRECLCVKSTAFDDWEWKKNDGFLLNHSREWEMIAKNANRQFMWACFLNLSFTEEALKIYSINRYRSKIIKINWMIPSKHVCACLPLRKK